MKHHFLFLLLPFCLEAENFLSLQVSNLSFEDGKTPSKRIDSSQPYALQFSRNLRMYLPSNLPYLRTKDASEAFLSFRKEIISSRKHPGFSCDDLILCFREPKSKIQGSLILYDKQDGWKPFPFTFELQNINNLLTEQRSEEEYLKHRITRYQWLQDLQVPGTAWFRHQLSIDQSKLAILQGEGILKSNSLGSNATRPSRKVGLEAMMDLFSGGRAISENLQLDRELHLSSDEQNRTIPLSSVSGITMDEIPWKQWMKAEKPKLDPVASILPHDQHAVIFSSSESMLEVMDEVVARGTTLLGIREERTESTRSKEKYSQQLCLPIDDLSRILGPKLISSVAITGSDPFFRTGTSLTLVFEAKQKQALLAALALQRMEIQKKFPKAQAVAGTIPRVQKYKYKGIKTEDCSIQSFVCSFENFIVVTNSLEQLTRLARVFDKKETSLTSLEEYHFFRQRYPITPTTKEDAFLMITDATIRRWCGPEWRIGASRRTRAASEISELQARRESGNPLNTKQFPELGKISVINGLVQSSNFGNLAFLKSVNELNIKKVTPAEKKAYELFRDRYQSHWSKYFDPISAQLSIENDRIKADLSILPLIGGTDYRQMIQMVGEVKLKPESGDPHAETVFHWVSALDMDSPRFKQASNFATFMAPSLGAGAFGWVGDSISVYMDDSPFFEDIQRAFHHGGMKGLEKFTEKNLGRIPIGFNVEVRNPFKLTAFLAGLRAWIERTAPGMTVWSNHSHKGQGYVKIAPGQGLESDLIKEGSSAIALYYVPSPKLLTVSLSEQNIKRAIERNLIRRDKTATLPKANWGGLSSAFMATNKIISIFDFTIGQNVMNGLQRKSWKNIHALNEWRINLKKQNPVAYHKRVWQTELHCPGGGEYVWNQKFQSYESSAFGHPAEPKTPAKLSLLGKWESIDLGVTFENDGLRIKTGLNRSNEQ